MAKPDTSDAIAGAPVDEEEEEEEIDETGTGLGIRVSLYRGERQLRLLRHTRETL